MIRRGLIGAIDAIARKNENNLIRNLKKIVRAIERRYEVDPKFDPPAELDKNT